MDEWEDIQVRIWNCGLCDGHERVACNTRQKTVMPDPVTIRVKASLSASAVVILKDGKIFWVVRVFYVVFEKGEGNQLPSRGDDGPYRDRPCATDIQ